MPSLSCVFGSDNALVHCVRAYQKYCIMVGLKVMTEERLARLQDLINNYDKWCKVRG
jgi:hypothetical protein